jgi:creatinine amidohydrolase/Fe(II)-dependent formamide hydrolase-like protein
VHIDRYVEGAQGHPHPEWASYDFNGQNRVALVEMFHRGAPRGIVGLPSLASAEKGQQLLERTAEKIVQFVRDFSTW